MSSDYGPELVAHFLLSEMRAYGLIERHGSMWVYEGHRDDFEIEVTARPVRKTVRLSED